MRPEHAAWKKRVPDPEPPGPTDPSPHAHVFTPPSRRPARRDLRVAGSRYVRSIDPDPARRPGRELIEGSSLPAEFVDFGGLTYFVAKTAPTGRELFSTQGTAATTQLAFDLAPGSLGSNPLGLRTDGSRLFWIADSSSGSGQSVYFVSGTPAGPLESPLGSEGVSAVDAVIVGGRYIARPRSTGGFPATVFSVDGSGALETFSRGSQALLVDPTATTPTPRLIAGPATAGTQLAYFVAATPGSVEVYSTDGTDAGTQLLATLPVPTAAALLRALDFIAPSSLVLVTEPLVSSTSVVSVIDVGLGSISSAPIPGPTVPIGQPNDSATFGGRTIVTRIGVTGLVAVQPTGTVTDIAIPAGTATPTTILGEAGGSLFLGAGERVLRLDPGTNAATLVGSIGGTPLSGGATTSSQRLLARFESATQTVLGSIDPSNNSITVVQDRVRSQPIALASGLVAFAADDPANATEPWLSDGTAAGTSILSNLEGIVLLDLDSDPDGYAGFGNGVAFLAKDNNGGGLFLSDGTTAGTVEALDLAASPQLFGLDPRTIDAGSRIFVDNNSGLFVLDPIAGFQAEVFPRGLRAIGERFGDGVIASTFSLTALVEPDGGNTLLATGFQSVAVEVFGESAVLLGSNAEARLTDGTAAGTSSIGVVDPTNETAAFDGSLVTTLAGLTRLSDEGSTPLSTATPPGAQLVRVDEKLFALSSDVLVFDGAQATTQPLPTGAPVPGFTAALGDNAVFRANTGSATGLFITDGTTAGTSLLWSPGPASPAPSLRGWHTVSREQAYFVVGNGPETDLFVTDGTPGGTTLVQSLPSFRGSAFVHGSLYLTIDDPLSVSNPSYCDLLLSMQRSNRRAAATLRAP